MGEAQNQAPPPLDLRGPDPTESPTQLRTVDLRELPPYSAEWAEIVRPIAVGLLCLIGAVVLVPFLIVVCVSNDTGKLTLDWAKTVLPPVVGFGGALVGYYFGTRGIQQEGS